MSIVCDVGSAFVGIDGRRCVSVLLAFCHAGRGTRHPDVYLLGSAFVGIDGRRCVSVLLAFCHAGRGTRHPDVYLLCFHASSSLKTS